MPRIHRKSLLVLPKHDIDDSSIPDQIHLDLALDEALAETFPASDPIAVSIDIVFYRAMPDAPAPSRRAKHMPRS